MRMAVGEVLWGRSRNGRIIQGMFPDFPKRMPRNEKGRSGCRRSVSFRGFAGIAAWIKPDYRAHW